MRFVVLGAGGQLGRDLCRLLPGEVVALTRDQADLTQADALRTTLTALRPTVVVNSAAYNFVDRAETEPAQAFAVNAFGPRNVAQICRDLDCVLVHFSTDYVFGQQAHRRTPYTETDAPGPLSVYGASKLTGEYLVQSVCPRHFILRTCGLFGVWGAGGKGGNFVETMLRVAGQGKPLRVVDDQLCTPSYTADVAAATVALLETSHYGLYHVTNAGWCSWHEFAQTIFSLSGIEANLTPITAREFGAAAARPAYSVLSPGAYQALGLPPVRNWREGLAAYLEERRARMRAAIQAA